MAHMETLDLHGVRYEEVELTVEKFLYMKELPVRIITGNSLPMKTLVNSVLKQYNLHGEAENHWNLGSMIITEQNY